MASKSRFTDDMQPRSFPKDKKPTVKISGVVPKPTLPGVSIIADRSKFAPKKTFLKWKQQHEALFEPMKFQTTSRTAAPPANKRKTDAPTVNSKFELDFHKAAPIQHGNQEEYQHKPDRKIIFPSNGKKPEFQSMMTFSQLNRVARSEAIRFDVPLEGQHIYNQLEDSQSNPRDCRCVAVAPSNRHRNNELANDQEPQSDLRLMESSKEIYKKPKESPTNEALANIVEEQIEIVMQQKHILMQQNEIFNLQYQIEKLLLMNKGLNNGKQLQSTPIRKSIATSPIVKAIESGQPQTIVNYANPSPKACQSIGVMTSFQCNLNEVWSPNRNQNLASESDPHKDTMLERINKIIKNSPPMLNHRLNNGSNCRISPKRADINFSSQTLMYKTSTRNNISVNDPKVADRSYALHVLDMKYHPETPSSPNTNCLHPRRDAIDKTKRSPAKVTDNDFLPLNISPDKYDYLIRHGLLKQ